MSSSIRLFELSVPVTYPLSSHLKKFSDSALISTNQKMVSRSESERLISGNYPEECFRSQLDATKIESSSHHALQLELLFESNIFWPSMRVTELTLINIVPVNGSWFFIKLTIPEIKSIPMPSFSRDPGPYLIT